MMFAKLKVYLIMFAAFAVFAGIAYWYYIDTQKALRQYAENQGKLETAIKTQASANEALRSDMANMQKAFTNLSEEFEEARQQVKDVENLFKKGTDGRDMTVGERALENPEYIEEVLNTGTTELFRCFEILTGAPLGDQDAQAKYVKCVDGNSDSTTSK
tara:strand:- start:310 stop:786 length:477 start_codon:yes stop_codon:yes gene_type:complete